MVQKQDSDTTRSQTFFSCKFSKVLASSVGLSITNVLSVSQTACMESFAYLTEASITCWSCVSGPSLVLTGLAEVYICPVLIQHVCHTGCWLVTWGNAPEVEPECDFTSHGLLFARWAAWFPQCCNSPRSCLAPKSEIQETGGDTLKLGPNSEPFLQFLSNIKDTVDSNSEIWQRIFKVWRNMFACSSYINIWTKHGKLCSQIIRILQKDIRFCHL